MGAEEGKPRTKAAGCFLEYNSHFLILRRSLGEHQEGKWGVPAGRVEQGETERDAVIREVREETGFIIQPDKLEFLQEVILYFPEKTTDFFAYRVKLESQITIVLNPQEHDAHAWVTGEECFARNDLIRGVRDVLKRVGSMRV